MNFSLNKQHGLSLIELMVAITLSMVLTLGVIQIFTSSKQTSRVQESLARLQENARFALDILSHDIRMAGQLGCNGNAEIFNTTEGETDELREFGSGIFGYEQSASPAIQLKRDESISTPTDWEVTTDTDAIVVISANPNSIPIKSVLPTSIQVASGELSNIDQGDPVLVSDCINADLAIAGNKPSSDTLNIVTTSTYNTGAELAELNFSAYRVLLDTKSGYRNLHRAYLNAQTGSISVDQEPLLEGVEDFQILYGEDVGGGNIRYVDATPANDIDWSNVTSVRIYLLLSTLEDGLATEPQNYWYLNVNGCTESESNTIALCDPKGEDDLHLYRSFTTTIQLRNQGIGI